MTHTRLSGRALALAGLVALALVPAACGGSDGDGDATGAQSAADDGGGATTAAGKAPVAIAPDAATTDEERELLAIHNEMLVALHAGDGAAYCDHLAPASRQAVPRLLNSGSCEQMVERFAANDDKAKRPEPKVIDVRIKGDRGIVETRVRKGRDTGLAQYVERDGEWLGVIVPATGDTPDGTFKDPS